MKPIELKLQAFGPYIEEMTVDFNELSKNGLFLICGKTGSGKTALLDAMMFALYGASSGDNRNDLSFLRSNLAERRDTFVSFTFFVRGEQYRFERGLKMKRINLEAYRNAFKRDEEGNWQPLFENPTEAGLNAKAKELIGFDANQFRKVIILPQGKFERLLVSETEEKEKILDEIFPVGKWEEIAERLKNKMVERYEAIKGKKDEVDKELKKLGCNSVDELTEKIREKEKELQEKIDEHEAKKYDEKKAKLEEESADAKKYAEDMQSITATKEALAKEKERETGCNKTKSEVDKAKRARNLKQELDRLIEKKSELKEREANLKNSKLSLENAQGKVKDIEKKANEIILEEKEQEKNKEERTLCEKSKDAYEKLAACEKDIAEQKKKVDELTKDFGEKEAAHKNAKITLQRVERERKELSERYERLNDTYLENIAGELALELSDGKPCPVCGSTAHPQKAQKGEGSVSRVDVDEAKEKRDKKEREKSDADNRRESAETEEKTSKNALDAANGELRVFEEKKKAAKEFLIDGIESKDALEKKISDLAKAIDDFDARKNKIEEEKNNLKNILSNAEANFENASLEAKKAKKSFEDAGEALNEALAREGFESEKEAYEAAQNIAKIEAWEKFIVDYERKVEVLKHDIERLTGETQGKTLRSLGEINKDRDDIDKAKEAFTKDKTSRENEIVSLKESEKQFKREMKIYDENIKEAEDDSKFSKKLKGDTGIGLKRYVLGIMFSQVVAAANELLVKIHGGRYRLHRSDEASNNSKKKKGLELAVTDYYGNDNKERFAITLSGGEKFLVSLALALGLSTACRTGGISVEALFIDEGFGSLDEDSISDALEVLRVVREANGIVGIISHVELLRENIPTKLLVEKSVKGSKLKTVIG